MIDSTLCYIEKDGKYLMLYRNKKKHDVNGGKYVGVGGKFEPGETADACLLREVFEETGLRLTSYHCHGIVVFRSDEWEDENMYLYSATDFDGSLNETCDEGELRWVAKEEVLALPAWAGDRYFLRPLLRGEKEINMELGYIGDRLVKFSTVCGNYNEMKREGLRMSLNLNAEKKETELNYALEGRLDTTTAPLLEESLKENIDAVEKLVFDFEKLEYISSAGLRTLLSAQKTMNKQGEMVIKNVCESIMEVFDITGFTDILTIEK